MSRVQYYVGVGFAVTLAFAVQVSTASAQVVIRYGNSPYGNYNSYPQYSVPSYNYGQSYGYQTVTPYQRVTPQYSVPTQRYSSGYRGNYGVPYQSNRAYQGGIQYGTQFNGNAYYGNGRYSNGYSGSGYYGTPSQQRGAVIGGAIGNAIGGQQSGNIGSAIGAAIGSQ